MCVAVAVIVGSGGLCCHKSVVLGLQCPQRKEWEKMKGKKPGFSALALSSNKAFL
jgi:hypothetical protein